MPEIKGDLQTMSLTNMLEKDMQNWNQGEQKWSPNMSQESSICWNTPEKSHPEIYVTNVYQMEAQTGPPGIDPVLPDG